MDTNQRPRTKRLERPTPNLTHPVISNKKSNENDLQLEECIQVMKRCRISSLTNARNKLKVKSNSMSTIDDSRQTNNKPKISEFKLNYHKTSDLRTVSGLQTKRDNNIGSVARSNSEDISDSASIQKTSQELKNVKEVNEIVEINNSDKTIEKEESDWSGWQQFNAQLIPCSHCCRTFFPHRLPVHEKCCKGNGSKKTNHRSKPILRNSPIVKCVSFECTTCRRKYRTTSLTSHQIKCKAINFRKRLNAAKIETKNKSITDYR